MGTTAWPFGRGEMAERICTHDWAATPLGPIPSWPQSLKAAVELMLASGFPTCIHWGRDAILLYNDAKAHILGTLHPGALGRPAFDALPLTRQGLEPVIRRVMEGESVILADQRYLIQEKGSEREIWVDHLASPMRDETGDVAGLWMVLIDVSPRVQAERRRRQAEDALRESEARQAFLLTLSDELWAIGDPDAILATATKATGEHFGVNRCCYGEISGNEVRLSSSWLRDVGPLPQRFALTDYADCLSDVCLTGRAVVVDDVGNDLRITAEERQRLRAARIAAFICVPVRGTACVGMQSAIPRAWTPYEVDQLREIGERAQLAARRARAETALRDSEERFRQFAQASTGVILIRDAKTLKLEYWSPGFEDIFGDQRHRLLGGNVNSGLDIVIPEDRERVQNAISRVRSGERFILDYRIRRPCDGEVRWTHSNVFPLLDAAGDVQRIGSICYDTTAEKEAADRMETMVAELQHRTRNLMAVLQSIVTQTIAASDDLASFKKRIDERLKALSHAHHLLSRSHQEPVTIGALVQLELDAFGDVQPSGRIEVSGPDVKIRNSTVQMLALAMHELAIDARTDGALSTDQGRLRIEWTVEQLRGTPHLRLNWIEERDVRVAVPREGRGDAQELIERALPYSLHAETRYELDESGLRCTISLPLTKEGPKERGA